MVGGADIDVREGVGAIKEFGGRAEVGNGLPDEEGFGTCGVQNFSPAENRGYEVDAADW